MTQTMDNNTTQLFQALTNDFANVEGDQGFSIRPSEGSHDCWVTGISAEPSVFRDSEGTEHNSVRVTFSYQLMEDAERDVPLKWNGSPMNIPLNVSAVPGTEEKGSRARARIELQRLKGHLQCILQEDCDDITEAVTTVNELLAGEQGVAVKVYCNYRKYTNRDGQKRQGFTEKLQERLSV